MKWRAVMQYETLLGAAKGDPGSVDFTVLRLAYVNSSAYDPYNRDRKTVDALIESLAGDAKGQAIPLIHCLLDQHYLDTEAHALAASLYRDMGDKTKAAYHLQFAGAILNSIFSSGNGQSCQSAFVVVDIEEEYAVLKYLGLQPERQSLKEDDGHFYDVFEFHPSKIDQFIEVYFNIDFPKRWLDQQIAQFDPEGRGINGLIFPHLLPRNIFSF
jgi:hypothetical protein